MQGNRIQNVLLAVLIVILAHAHAAESAAYHEEFADGLVDTLVNNAAGALVFRTVRPAALQSTRLDTTMLGKAGKLSIATSPPLRTLVSPLRHGNRLGTRMAIADESRSSAMDGAGSAGLVSTRRNTLLALGSAAFLSSALVPALAVQDGERVEVAPVLPFSLEDFAPKDGWTELDSGLLYKVVTKGEGDLKKGILETVDHYVPCPFVTVKYTAYDPSGKAFASTEAVRRNYNYQAGVKSELQDEPGAVMNMKVGERRQFVLPRELAYKRKLFGQLAPAADALLVDVELLFLQPY